MVLLCFLEWGQTCESHMETSPAHIRDGPSHSCACSTCLDSGKSSGTSTITQHNDNPFEQISFPDDDMKILDSSTTALQTEGDDQGP